MYHGIFGAIPDDYRLIDDRRPMITIDETDRRLLRVLQVDGRISNLELADRCNLSASACSDRVRRLREHGFITGYAAVVDPDKVGRALLIFVEVVLDRTTKDAFDDFAAAARRAATSWSTCRACGKPEPMRCWRR